MPRFAALVERIREVEQCSEALLRERLAATRGELTALRSRRSAGRAYQSADRVHSFAPIDALAETPRLFDLHS